MYKSPVIFGTKLVMPAENVQYISKLVYGEEKQNKSSIVSLIEGHKTAARKVERKKQRKISACLKSKEVVVLPAEKRHLADMSGLRKIEATRADAKAVKMEKTIEGYTSSVARAYYKKARADRKKSQKIEIAKRREQKQASLYADFVCEPAFKETKKENYEPAVAFSKKQLESLEMDMYLHARCNN